MNIKSIMLGTAAGFMAVSGAQAADLPGEPLPVAVDYVKVCDTFGAGFFYIPGTETCLDISGRVRFRVEYNGERTIEGDDIRFVADGRVDFDARTMTEYGQLRSFFRLGNGFTTATNDEGVEIDAAFIQLGYLTVGYTGDLFNGDVLFGDRSFGYTPGDQDRLQITVLANDIGGGFYAGISATATRAGQINESVDNDGELHLQAAAGIASQPWGGIDVSVAYAPEGVVDLTESAYAIKATANLSLIENLDARLVAAYATEFEYNQEYLTLAAALAYTAGPATLYTGVRWDIVDNAANAGTEDNAWGANLGVDYAIVPGLTATAELSYDRDLTDNDEFQGLLQLSRTW